MHALTTRDTSDRLQKITGEKRMPLVELTAEQAKTLREELGQLRIKK
jgi:hypothetical protein